MMMMKEGLYSPFGNSTQGPKKDLGYWVGINLRFINIKISPQRYIIENITVKWFLIKYSTPNNIVIVEIGGVSNFEHFQNSK